MPTTNVNKPAPHIEIDIAVSEPRWMDAFSDLETLARETALKAAAFIPLKQDTEISLSFVNDEEIRVLNRDYRNKDKATNVLSFPQNEPGMLGDVVFAYETIAREAREQLKTPEDHLRHLLVHGFLHLVGYDHEDEAEADEMENLESEILASMGVKNPYETP